MLDLRDDFYVRVGQKYRFRASQESSEKNARSATAAWLWSEVKSQALQKISKSQKKNWKKLKVVDRIRFN